MQYDTNIPQNGKIKYIVAAISTAFFLDDWIYNTWSLFGLYVVLSILNTGKYRIVIQKRDFIRN